MSRFKELRRSEAAIEHPSRGELEWAAAYCAMRVKLSARRDHLKHWRRVERKVEEALLSLQPHDAD